MNFTTDQIISIVGITVTAIFSILVWWATRATAKATKATVEVAQQTLRLNESLATAEKERELEYRSIRKSQLKSQMLRDVKKASDAFSSKSAMEVFNRLQQAPVELSVTDEDIASYFKREEEEIIRSSWRFYMKFREDHFRQRYPGNEINVLTEKGPAVIDQLHKAQTILM